MFEQNNLIYLKYINDTILFTSSSIHSLRSTDIQKITLSDNEYETDGWFDESSITQQIVCSFF